MQRRNRNQTGFQTCGCQRVGFTVVELMVTLTVIAVLLGLILPAIQTSRRAASRISCTNRLRQIAIALQSHESTHRVLPPGMTSKSDRSTPGMSWMVALLPFLEQTQAWEDAMSAYSNVRSPFRNPPHIGLSRAMAAFTCPDDERVSMPQSASALNGAYIGLTSYLGVSGTDLGTEDGALFYGTALRLADFTDGLSNTVIVGERPPTPDFNLGWWYSGMGQDGSGSADVILGMRERLGPEGSRLTEIGCPDRSRYSVGRISNPCDGLHFWSLHSGGSHFALSDGSVRQFPYDSGNTLELMATRAGGETTN